jgi:WW domain-containing oxidoreductase
MKSSFDGRSTSNDVLAGRDLSERVVLVTGAAAGIGFETARALASRGARVVAGCRTEASARATVAAIREMHPSASVTPLALDLSSFAAIRRAVRENPLPRVDAVICNAGLFASRFRTTEDGIEETVGVCHFGHFLLVTLLMDALRAAAPARVVMVSSESHRHPKVLDFERFPLTSARYRPLISYGQAKLCNVLFANELTRRFAKDGIHANSLHPGAFIGTSIFRDTRPGRIIAAVLSPFTKTIPQGAATTLYCTVAPELERVGGRYYADCAEKPASRGALDEITARKLWALSEARIATEPEPQRHEARG